MKNIKLLLIEDDRVDQIAFQRFVEEQHLPFLCSMASSVQEAKKILKTGVFDIIVADYRLGDGDVFDILDQKLDIQTIITTGAGNEEVAVRAMKAGASDYLIKDLDRNYLKILPMAVERAINQKKAAECFTILTEKESEEASIFGGEGLKETLKLIELAATSDSPVFITGETGTGKNLVARAIHYQSPLRTAPFISINCAALPEHLIEAELFGHEKGAYTGAVTAKKGIFELAEGGTLLLDELGEMPMHLQTKLLGVLDDKQVRRLGSESTRPVDVRIISSTNSDLEKSLGKTFRHDLFYRISVIRISLPPLRERRADIPALCHHLLKKLNKGIDVEISDAELNRLQEYQWPGNVRELKNILERTLILHRGSEMRPSELIDKGTYPISDGLPAQRVETSTTTLHNAQGIAPTVTTLEDMEREHIRRTLASFSGNITKSSKALGISITTLKRKKKLYQLM
jgi:DNA-binding NtrC family response regulator